LPRRCESGPVRAPLDADLYQNEPERTIVDHEYFIDGRGLGRDWKRRLRLQFGLPADGDY